MYRAPVSEISHVLTQMTGLGSMMEEGKAGELSSDLLDAVLLEAGKFASDEIAPLSRQGDEQGTAFKEGQVNMPKGWADLYQRWCEGGWNSLTGPAAYGGQELPMSLQTAAFEMWNSGSLAFGIGPTLTIGAIEALNSHADEALKKNYLEKLVSGEWMGTMNLTEPQSGSDLNGLKARAEPVGDGSYRIYGQKIFITYGEHDMSENIIHLVLARLPDAPAGQRGISLFLVPKFLVNEDGSLGPRNDVICASVEHKMGIHASPTCVMMYGDGSFSAGLGGESGALGWLIGEENRGLSCMFTMMNNARLLVGIQGVAVAEAATQLALSYAHDRTQGKAEGYQGQNMAPIVYHPDVQRNLLTMRALTDAARIIAYNCAHAIDCQHLYSDEEQGSHWRDRAALLTPISKAFASDIGCEVTSLGVQVHGGMGYIEETGAAQLMRDARIAPIYEGTNGIQAIDLVTRKLPLEGGAVIKAYCDEMKAHVEEIANCTLKELAKLASPLNAAIHNWQQATDYLLNCLQNGDQQAALAGASPYLRLCGLAMGGVYLAQSALKSKGEEQNQRALVASFMAHNLVGQTASLWATIEQGAESLLAAGDFLSNQERVNNG